MEVIYTGSICRIKDTRFAEYSWGVELYRDPIDGVLYRRTQGKEQPHLEVDTASGPVPLRKMNREELREYKGFCERVAE